MQNSRAAFYHYEPLEIGGPCGLCSRYLSLDRRVLWLIELTDLFEKVAATSVAFQRLNSAEAETTLEMGHGAHAVTRPTRLTCGVVILCRAGHGACAP